MNELQKNYLRVTREGDICLSMWAHFAEQRDPAKIDKTWTSCGLPFLLTLGKKGQRAHKRLFTVKDAQRMAIWAKVKETKEHQDAMESKANRQIQRAADDVTTELEAISSLKHKLLDEETDDIVSNKKLHMAASASNLDQEQQQNQIDSEESDVEAAPASKSIAATSSSSSSSSGGALVVSPDIVFDPTKDPVSSVLLGGIDIGPAFARLQMESAEVVNDLSKNMSMQLLPLFLAANFIWNLDHELPGLSEETMGIVQQTLNIPLLPMPKELAVFGYDLDQELAATGWIKSRSTETRDQDDLLVLFQQICKKLPRKYLTAGPLKNEDSHAHSTFDALMTCVFPGKDRHYQLHWANRKSKGSGDRRGGDHLALKPDATVTKDCYELGFVELKAPREDRNERFFLEDVWALTGFAKDCIDRHLRHGRKITNVACLHVFGFQLTLYQMSFHNGIYVWQDTATAYLPRDHHDSGCTLRCLQLIRTFKVMACLERIVCLEVIHV
ncbi:unnamed protein product [Mortierella alpina]